jgi:hypothetical protein
MYLILIANKTNKQKEGEGRKTLALLGPLERVNLSDWTNRFIEERVHKHLATV